MGLDISKGLSGEVLGILDNIIWRQVFQTGRGDLEMHDEKTDLEESIAELERDIIRLKDEKEKMEGADNN